MTTTADNPSEDRVLGDLDLLHSISVALIGEQDRQALYVKIVDAAASITGSQFATMQVLCPADDASGHGGKLQLLCSRGLPPDAIQFWQWVNYNALSSCGLALRRGKRAIIADFEQWDEIAGTEELRAFRAAGIRAAQTTPLLSRSGQLLGMMSTHWAQPHHPSDRVLRLLDILARTAADLLERTLAEEALRELNDTLEHRVAQRTAELMAAEEKLRQSQKMEAVGQLTGGLAHDFNNLLGGISGSLELLSQRIEQGRTGEVERHLIAARNSASKAAILTHRLLAFSRQQTLEPRAVKLATLLQDMSELIQRTAGPAIRIETVCDQALWPAFVDASQLESAVLNLCNNARDAMPNGGTVMLEASNLTLSVQGAQRHELQPGQYVHLSVTDTGTGMSPDVLVHVFEPFFTTKPVGQGTGLGLSMIYGFAQQSGGQVKIRSKVGEGTRVDLYLPRHFGEVPEPEPEPAGDGPPLPALQGGKTVLLVEDERTLRMVVAETLEELGYQVLQAADGAAALELLRSGVRVDLLLSDVGLPGEMDGWQLAEKALGLNGALKTLFVTGYVQASELAAGRPVLSKPFTLQALGSRVGELLAD
ncbi:ATP-binding protein [Pseudomonas sp. NPDC089996]|uniref:ATP-binding protein n=1 Tax=Pseudomonas sp. NPDC089996 TaxID=3364474 RepID=UPI0038051CB9